MSQWSRVSLLINAGTASCSSPVLYAAAVASPAREGSGAARITPSTDSMVRKVAEHSILVHW